MSGKIVVGFDGSESSLDALALGRWLTAAADTTLLLVSVYGPDVFTPRRLNATSPLFQAAQRRLEPGRARLADTVGWEARVEESTSPARGLHELAEREQPDLVVVGSSLRGPVGRVLRGGVAQRLLCGSPQPVAVAPRGYAPEPGTPAPVGVGYDGSPEARAALRAASLWASALRTGLRVITAAGSQRSSSTAPDEGLEGARNEPEGRIRRELEDELAGLEGPRSVELTVLPGDPVAALPDASRDLALLIVGSRAYGPLRRVAVGSVSGALMRTAHCPVIAVPRGVQRPFAGLFPGLQAAA